MRTKLDNDFLLALYDVVRQMLTYADQMACFRGMTRAQWAVLAGLERRPSMCQNELAGVVGLSPITIVRVVDRLEVLGLVERSTDPEDRRIWRLVLTPAAESVLRDIDRYRVKLHHVMADGIDPAVLSAMLVGLSQMRENLNSGRRLHE
jgi:MarR family transcriptional regulator for hemolysin